MVVLHNNTNKLIRKLFKSNYSMTKLLKLQILNIILISVTILSLIQQVKLQSNTKNTKNIDNIKTNTISNLSIIKKKFFQITKSIKNNIKSIIEKTDYSCFKASCSGNCICPISNLNCNRNDSSLLSCDSTCNKGYFSVMIKDRKICEKCLDNCLECSHYRKCSECVKGYVNNKGTCIDSRYFTINVDVNEMSSLISNDKYDFGGIDSCDKSLCHNCEETEILVSNIIDSSSKFSSTSISSNSNNLSINKTNTLVKTIKICTECTYMYQNIKGTCFPCSLLDINCLSCDKNKCILCDDNFLLNSETNKCEKQNNTNNSSNESNTEIYNNLCILDYNCDKASISTCKYPYTFNSYGECVCSQYKTLFIFCNESALVMIVITILFMIVVFQMTCIPIIVCWGYVLTTGYFVLYSLITSFIEICLRLKGMLRNNVRDYVRNIEMNNYDELGISDGSVIDDDNNNNESNTGNININNYIANSVNRNEVNGDRSNIEDRSTGNHSKLSNGVTKDN